MLVFLLDFPQQLADDLLKLWRNPCTPDFANWDLKMFTLQALSQLRCPWLTEVSSQLIPLWHLGYLVCSPQVALPWMAALPFQGSGQVGHLQCWSSAEPNHALLERNTYLQDCIWGGFRMRLVAPEAYDRIIEWFELTETFKAHIVQLPCIE